MPWPWRTKHANKSSDVPEPVDILIQSAQDDISRVLGLFARGRLSPEQWYREMQVTLTRNWVGSYITGTGKDALSRAEETWLKREYNKHNTFLRQFRDDILNGRYVDPETGELRLGALQARSDMYAQRLRGLYEAGRAAGEEIELPFVPGSGATQCLTNCRCDVRYEMRDGQKVAIWHANLDSESCPDCVALNGKPHTEWAATVGAR